MITTTHTTHTTPSIALQPSRRDVELADRQGAVVGLAIFAGVLAVLAVLLAAGGATVFAAATGIEALVRGAEAIGVHRRHRPARRIAQGHCIVGALLASLSMPLGIIGVLANAYIFRALRED